jgi:hypothetical protein
MATRGRRTSNEELAKLEADANARYAALERRWEASGHTDLDALRGMLVFFQRQLPPALFKPLFALVSEKIRPGRGQSIKRTEQRLLMLDVVRRGRELQAENPSLTREQAADLVIAEMGPNAPKFRKIINAWSRSLHWSKKRSAR